MSFIALMKAWTAPALNEGWPDLVRAQVATLRHSDASAAETLRAWQQLAMLFGDTGAPEFCAVVALHALELDRPEQPEHKTISALRSHANLALLDLGLARSDTPGGIRIAELDTRVSRDDGDVRAWLRSFLKPVGSLAEGALACARLAEIRAGLVDRPDPLTVDAIRGTTRAE